jgi:hypothetical protein
MEGKEVLSEFSSRVHKRWLMFVLFIADIIAIIVTLVLAFSQLLEEYPIIFWLLVASIVLSNALVVFSYFAFRDVAKERDDFKKRLDSIKPNHSNPQNSKGYHLVWLFEKFFLRDSHGSHHSYDSTDEDGKTSLVLEATIRVNTLKMVEIQSIALDVAAQQIPSNWDDTNVFFESETVEDVRFNFPLNTPRGKQLARIRAIVDGEEYISSSFIIDFPKRNT